MMTTFAQAEAGYLAMWQKMVVKPGKVAEADAIVKKILPHKEDYQKVEAATGVPWFWVAGIHYREADLDFHTHLHNGDPLSARTVHVPAGRPKTGNPPFQWFESAIDALEYDGVTKVTDWSVARMGFQAEEYNGDGYERHHENSPYVWAGSNLQQPGKFVADGKFDQTVMDEQLGVMVLISRLMVADQSVADFINKSTTSPAPTPVPTTTTAPITAQPQKETPKMTTATPVTVTLPTLSSIPFASIEQGVESALPLLPIVATFVPGLAPVVTILTEAMPVIRAVTGVLTVFQSDVAAGKTTMVALADALTGLGAALKTVV